MHNFLCASEEPRHVQPSKKKEQKLNFKSTVPFVLLISFTIDIQIRTSYASLKESVRVHFTFEDSNRVAVFTIVLYMLEWLSSVSCRLLVFSKAEILRQFLNKRKSKMKFLLTKMLLLTIPP